MQFGQSFLHLNLWLRVESDCPIQQGLADRNPDVDAIYRLILPLPFSFMCGTVNWRWETGPGVRLTVRIRLGFQGVSAAVSAVLLHLPNDRYLAELCGPTYRVGEWLERLVQELRCVPGPERAQPDAGLHGRNTGVYSQSRDWDAIGKAEGTRPGVRRMLGTTSFGVTRRWSSLAWWVQVRLPW